LHPTTNKHGAREATKIWKRYQQSLIQLQPIVYREVTIPGIISRRRRRRSCYYLQLVQRIWEGVGDPVFLSTLEQVQQ
jgi:hypothetical protein